MAVISGKRGQKATIEFVPIDHLREIVGRVAATAEEQEIEEAMYRVAALVEAKAVQLAPVDTGNLEDSTYIDVHFRGPRKVVASIQFRAPYAALAHERDEEARGPKTRKKRGNEFGPAGPKYLERPLRSMRAQIGEDLAGFFRSIMRRPKGASRKKKRKKFSGADPGR